MFASSVIYPNRNLYLLGRLALTVELAGPIIISGFVHRGIKYLRKSLEEKELLATKVTRENKYVCHMCNNIEGPSDLCCESVWSLREWCVLGWWQCMLNPLLSVKDMISHTDLPALGRSQRKYYRVAFRLARLQKLPNFAYLTPWALAILYFLRHARNTTVKTDSLVFALRAVLKWIQAEW